MSDSATRPDSTDTEAPTVELARAILDDLQRDPHSVRLFFVVGYLGGRRTDDDLHALTEYVKTGRSDRWPELSA